MYKRKKNHGGLKALLLPLFIMLLSMFSTSYALTPSNQISTYGAQQLFDYFYNIKDNYKVDNWNKMDNFNAFYSNLQIDQATQTLNNAFTTWATTFPNLEQISFSFAVINSNYQLIAIQNNNTIGSNLPFIKLNGQVYSSSSNYSPSFITDNGASSNGTVLWFTFNSNGTLTYYNYQNTIPSLSYKLSPLFNKIENTDTANVWNFVSFGNSTFYLKSNNSDTLSWVWNTNKLYNEEPQPQEPSGDNTTGGTGTITNNSGDTTGKIDLSGIEQGIGNIQKQISGDSQRIIDNQIENTTAIIGAIATSNENYWGKSGDLTGEEQEEQIEEDVNEITETISGELGEREEIQLLEAAEKGFTDKFIDVRNAPIEAFDLKFSWDNTNPNFTMNNGENMLGNGAVLQTNTNLIPENEMNISKIVRENETLSVIHGYIRIIPNFIVIMNILKTIYNMIMQALGIAQPEINMNYETPIADKEIGEGQDGYMIDDTIHL